MSILPVQIRRLEDPESWPLKSTDLNPEVPEFVPTAPAAGPHGGPAKDSTATAAAKKSAAAQGMLLSYNNTHTTVATK